MKNYKVVAVLNNQISLFINGRVINFTLPITNGMYPEGDELEALLDGFYNDTILAEVDNKAINISAITELIEPLPVEFLANKIKRARSLLLTYTDWTQNSDTPLKADYKTAWELYRYELREITKQASYPESVVWPIPPAPVLNELCVPITDLEGNPIYLSDY